MNFLGAARFQAKFLTIQQVLLSPYQVPGAVLGPGKGGWDKINRNPCLVQCSRSPRGEIQFLNVLSKYIICRLLIGGVEENRARRYTMLERFNFKGL